MTNPNDVNLDPAAVQAARKRVTNFITELEIALNGDGDPPECKVSDLRLLLAELSDRDEAVEAMRTLEAFPPEYEVWLKGMGRYWYGRATESTWRRPQFDVTHAESATEAIKNLAHQLKGDQ